jgi:uncharacterized protein YidB (DUF937 family)
MGDEFEVLGNVPIGEPSFRQALSQVLAGVLANTKLGSLGGLLNQLQTSGLGGQVASWLGAGENLPVSVDQLRQALGDETVQQIASNLGVPIDKLLAQLSQHLPSVVDHVSPNGILPEKRDPSL